MSENTRAFLIGTHHGVLAHNLHLYLREVVARAYDDAAFTTRNLLGLIAPPRQPKMAPPPSTF